MTIAAARLASASSGSSSAMIRRAAQPGAPSFLRASASLSSFSTLQRSFSTEMPASSSRALLRSSDRRSKQLSSRSAGALLHPRHLASAAKGPPSTTEHAVISAFDLFSLGIGPSSSHTVGPMRAGAMFVSDLKQAGLLGAVASLKIALYGSLALTGVGHHTPQALLLGLEGADCETVDTASVEPRFAGIKQAGKIVLGRDTATAGKGGGAQEATFVYERDMTWHWDQRLPLHSNGLRLTVFDAQGDMLATNAYYSIGGGFVVNGALATANSAPEALAGVQPRSIHEEEPEEDADDGDRDAGAAASSPAPAQQKATEETGPIIVSDGSTAGAETAELAALAPATKERLDAQAHPVDVLENVFYKSIRREDATAERRHGQEENAGSSNNSDFPLISKDAAEAEADKAGKNKAAGEDGGGAAPGLIPYPFHNAASLLALSKRHNLTIAQIVYQNELSFNSPAKIREKIFRIWHAMDRSIYEGIRSTEPVLPGALKLKRRAPMLYQRLLRGFYPNIFPSPAPAPSVGDPSSSESSSPSSDGAPTASSLETYQPPVSPPVQVVRGSLAHPILPVPPRRTMPSSMTDFLSTYAIAVNEVNAAGGRVVTSPTNGAAGVIPSVLKWHLEFASDDVDRDVQTFLLTAAAIGMLFKRGATISAAEGGCQAEVGVASSMAAGALTAVLGGSPEAIAMAAECCMEHHLGLTCDPALGLVQIPCVERNALGAVKAVTAAQLALAGKPEHRVSLDDAIEAMRETAKHMNVRYKETSLGGLAKVVRIPVSQPDC